jgi:hypothetical protein
MSDERDLRPKPGVLAVLRRAGIPEHTVQALNAALEDPVDLRRDGNLLAHYGITLDRLTDRMAAARSSWYQAGATESGRA